MEMDAASRLDCKSVAQMPHYVVFLQLGDQFCKNQTPIATDRMGVDWQEGVGGFSSEKNKPVRRSLGYFKQ